MRVTRTSVSACVPLQAFLITLWRLTTRPSSTALSTPRTNTSATCESALLLTYFMTYRCIVSHTTLSEVLKVPIILLHSSITTDSVSRLYRLSYDMIAYTNAKRYQSLFIHMCVQAEHVVDHGHKICTFQTTVFYAIVIVFSVFFWGGLSRPMCYFISFHFPLAHHLP